MWLQKNESLSITLLFADTFEKKNVCMESVTTITEEEERKKGIHPPPCQQDLLHFQSMKKVACQCTPLKKKKLRIQRENLVGETPKLQGGSSRLSIYAPHPPTLPPSQTHTHHSALKADWLFIYLLALSQAIRRRRCSLTPSYA